ncbi:MAG: hypothetical protein ACTTKP_02250 [Catonella sp.]|uniref:hypothetical protein n=1 Tax=Catonella sp. TaxID=2382125 RepID=UPI003F9FE9B7
MQEKIKKMGMGLPVLVMLISLFLSQTVSAKTSDSYTALIQDYKMVKIKVPNNDFLTDNWNYSLHFKSDKDRWAVQTTVFTRAEDAENPDFQPAQKFSKGKTIRIGEKYYTDVEVKGLSYKITISFTKQYKKFFEGLKEKDFIVEANKGEEAYKNIIENQVVMGLSKEEIKNNVLASLDFDGFKVADKLKNAEKLVKKFKLKEAYDKKISLKRHKAGILLSEVFSAEDIDVSIARLIFAYYPYGYDVKTLDKGEGISYIELKKGKNFLPILLVYDGLKTDNEKGKAVEGTDKIIVYVLKKPL